MGAPLDLTDGTATALAGCAAARKHPVLPGLGGPAGTRLSLSEDRGEVPVMAAGVARSQA